MNVYGYNKTYYAKLGSHIMQYYLQKIILPQLHNSILGHGTVIIFTDQRRLYLQFSLCHPFLFNLTYF